jgi:hypothetical protein
MKILLVQCLQWLSLLMILSCGMQLAAPVAGQAAKPGASKAAKQDAGQSAKPDAGQTPKQAAAQAAPILVRHVVGTMHGFLDLRSEDGKIVASGDLVQVPSGGNISAELTFHFTDGSIDDETTVFSQRHTFQLITYHHIQKGPTFPHPVDLMIDTRTQQVTVRSTGKDGKDDVKTHHMRLPPDLADGLVSDIIENIRSGAVETRIPVLAATPDPRIVTLVISPRGEDPYALAGSSRKGTHYEIKIEIGGVAGIVAPMIGKQPPNIQVWIIGGPAPSFLKEQGPLYPDGPVLTMELVSPTWPEAAHAGN